MRINQVRMGMVVDVEPEKDDVFHEFRGTIVGFVQKSKLVVVEDQDGNGWNCFPRQLTLVTE